MNTKLANYQKALELDGSKYKLAYSGVYIYTSVCKQYLTEIIFNFILKNTRLIGFFFIIASLMFFCNFFSIFLTMHI